MAETKRKGDLGEAMVLADAFKRGYKVALPMGEDWRFDLVVLRKGKLERVQCKYVESDGEVLLVPCRAVNSKLCNRYTQDEIDWIAVYDKTTDKCYYFPSTLLGAAGKTYLNFRIQPPANGQIKGIHWAKDFESW